MINREVLDVCWISHPEVHCHGSLSIFSGSEQPPERDTSTCRAEVVLKIRPANIGLRWTSHDDLFVLTAVGPQSSPPPA